MWTNDRQGAGSCIARLGVSDFCVPFTKGVTAFRGRGNWPLDTLKKYRIQLSTSPQMSTQIPELGKVTTSITYAHGLLLMHNSCSSTLRGEAGSKF